MWQDISIGVCARRGPEGSWYPRFRSLLLLVLCLTTRIWGSNPTSWARTALRARKGPSGPERALSAPKALLFAAKPQTRFCVQPLGAMRNMFCLSRWGQALFFGGNIPRAGEHNHVYHRAVGSETTPKEKPHPTYLYGGAILRFQLQWANSIQTLFLGTAEFQRLKRVSA